MSGLLASPWFAMALLAIVQGVTEFLPVSSSGHLALGEAILGFGDGSVLEEIVLHVGTLFAVCFFYRADLAALARGAFAAGGGTSRRYLGLLLFANIPAGIVGIGFKEPLEAMFDDVALVLVAMAVTGVVLFLTRRVQVGDRAPGWRSALLMGLAQALAIIPGCSRSGWTIATGLALGLKPAEAARFSFLMSLPAIGGATVLQLGDLPEHTPGAGPIALGLLLSAFVGWLALAWLVRLVRDMALHRFAWYLWAVAAVGGVVLLLSP